jgi:hypothetical protein
MEMLRAAALLEPVVVQALVFEGARAIPDVGFFGIGAKPYRSTGCGVSTVTCSLRGV